MGIPLHQRQDMTQGSEQTGNQEGSLAQEQTN
jgi:hypothetical protein